MRNLKRALSLTLASVMLLGMMVVGTSAASFPDVTAEDNVEAIEVLAAVKVLQGYDDGQYHADTPVTRNQMATIICRMMGWRDGDFAGLNPFPDVPDWAANYVAACVANGIINGRDDGRFHGDDTVTATEAASMMLRALGYTRMPVGADWARAVAQQASKINLFDELDVGAYTALTRGDVSQLALNTLESAMVEVEDNTLSIEAGNGVTVSGGQINYVVVTSSKDYAKSISRAESSGNALNGVNGPIVELGEHVFNGDLKKVASIDAFGAPSTRWTYKNVEVGNYAETEDYKFEGTVKSNAMYAAVGKNAAEKYQWTVTMDGTDIDVKAASDKQALFTGSDVADNDRDDLAGTHNGTVTYVYLDDTAVTDKNDRVIYNGTATVCIVNTYAAEVIKVSGNTITLDDMDKSGLEFDSTGYAEGDIVLYTKTVNHDGGNSKIQNILGKAELVEGKADEVRESATAGDRVTIGDKNYSYSHRFNGDNGGKLTIASAGKDVAFYLDKQDNIIRMGDVNESNDYAYVYDVGQTTSGYSNDSDFGATLIMTDGTKKKVDLDSDTTKPLAVGANATAKTTALRTALQGHIVSYTVEDNGNYNLDIKSSYRIIWDTAQENLLKEGLSRLDVANKTSYEKWTKTTGNQGNWGADTAATLYANKNSAILVNESIEDNDKFGVYTGYEALPNVNSVVKDSSKSINTTAVAYVKDGVIRAMYIMDAEISGSSKDAIFIVGQGGTPKVYDNGSNEYHVYDVVQDGKIDSIRVKNGSSADTKLCALADKQVGIFFKIKTNSAGFVTDVDATLPTDIAVNGVGKTAQAAGSTAIQGGDWSAKKYNGVGRVDGELRFHYNPTNDTWGVRPGTGNDALVVYYTEENKLSLEGIHADRNDECYVITDDGKIIAIFVKEIKDGTTNNNGPTQIPGLEILVDKTKTGMSAAQAWEITAKASGTQPTTDQVIAAIIKEIGLPLVDNDTAIDDDGTTITIKFQDTYGVRYVKYNHAAGPVKVVGVTDGSKLGDALANNDEIILDTNGTLNNPSVPYGKKVTVSDGKELTLSGSGSVGGVIDGAGDVKITGTITNGQNIQVDGTVTLGAGGKIGTSGCVTNGEPSIGTAAKPADVVLDGAGIAEDTLVHGTVTVAADTTITDSKTLAAAEIVVKAGKTLNLGTSGDLRTQVLRFEAGAKWKDSIGTYVATTDLYIDFATNTINNVPFRDYGDPGTDIGGLSDAQMTGVFSKPQLLKPITGIFATSATPTAPDGSNSGTASASGVADGTVTLTWTDNLPKGTYKLYADNGTEPIATVEVTADNVKVLEFTGIADLTAGSTNFDLTVTNNVLESAKVDVDSVTVGAHA